MSMMPFFSVPKEKRKSTAKTGCAACGLYKDCISPRMALTGTGNRGLFILAEAPGEKEDRHGVQLVGKSGQELRAALERHGIDLDADCWKMNAVNCRPKDNATPTDKQIACCRSRVMAEIEKHKPRVILALGNPAMKSLCQHRSKWSRGGFPGIKVWQGEAIPDQDMAAFIVPTWHPAFLGYKEAEDNVLYRRRWLQDIRRAVDHLDHPRPVKIDYTQRVKTYVNDADIEIALEKLYRYLIKNDIPVSFDYEATGLKPYLPGHEIVSCSFAWFDIETKTTIGIAFVFSKVAQKWTKRILTSPKIKKRAHNAAFEYLWTLVRASGESGYKVINFDFDTALGARISDNRTGRAGLKFLSYVKLGLLGYDDGTSDYLVSDSSNGFNNIKQAPVEDILTYNAIDSICTDELAEIQLDYINNTGRLAEAYRIYHDGALALANIEKNGIGVDLEYVQTQKTHIQRRIDRLQRKIMEDPAVVWWKDNYRDDFNLGSPLQLTNVLYNHLNMPVLKETKGGKPSVDQEALEKMPVGFVKNMLDMRRLEKIKGTYLKAFENEAPDGVLHPFFKLTNVISYRGSCDSPNFQNIPKHDADAQKICRRAIKPPLPGYCWLDVDYASIEVRIAATYHQDPNMIKYLNDPYADMHRDVAADLFMLPTSEITKTLRFAAKNNFVFAQFYGDYWGQIAPKIWADYIKDSPDKALLKDGITHIKDHLRRKGIRNEDQFASHVHKIEDHFWGTRFPVYARWREDHWAQYQKRGYFESHLGFRYSSIMTRNESINFGTQGTAFHCLLWSLPRIDKAIHDLNLKSFIMGQIHDAGCFAVWPSEINGLLPLIRSIMVDELQQRFDWINVPMDVEFEISPIDGTWYDIKEFVPRKTPCSCGLNWQWKDTNSCLICGK